MNPYSNPEKFGLRLVGTVDFSESYEYDTIAVWKNAEGKFLRGHSSGCSCSSPFEYEGLGDLEPTDPNDFKRYATEYADGQYNQTYRKSWEWDITEVFERMVSP